MFGHIRGGAYGEPGKHDSVRASMRLRGYLVIQAVGINGGGGCGSGVGGRRPRRPPGVRPAVDIALEGCYEGT